MPTTDKALQKEVKRLFQAAARYDDERLELEEADPDDDDAMQALDAALESLEVTYREIIRLVPDNIEALTKLGALFLERADAADEALLHLEAALALAPKDQALVALVKQAKAELRKQKRRKT